MADYEVNNRGALFKNDRKIQDTHADYNGSLNVGGTEYWLNAWLKEGKNGKFFSLSVRPKDQTGSPSPKKDTVVEFDTEAPINLDDIPF